MKRTAVNRNELNKYILSFIILATIFSALTAQFSWSEMFLSQNEDSHAEESVQTADLAAQQPF